MHAFSEMTRPEERVHRFNEKKSGQNPIRPIPDLKPLPNLIPIQNKQSLQHSRPPPPPPPVLPLPSTNKAASHGNQTGQMVVVRHEKVVHLKKKFFRCSKCNYVALMKARLTKHVKSHSMPMRRPPPPPPPVLPLPPPPALPLMHQLRPMMQQKHMMPHLPSHLTVKIGQKPVRPIPDLKPLPNLIPIQNKQSLQHSRPPPPPPPVLPLPSTNKAASHGNQTGQMVVVRHEKVVHLKKKFFRCSKCNYVALMKARLTKHVKSHSMPMRRPPPPPPPVLPLPPPPALPLMHQLRPMMQQKHMMPHLPSHLTVKIGQKPVRPIPDLKPLPNLIPIQNKQSPQHSRPPPLPALPLMHQSRPMMQQKHMMPHLPSHHSFQQSMNRHPFLPQHLQPASVEIAPGIGAVTSTTKAASHGNQTGQMVQNKEVKPKPDNSVKKNTDLFMNKRYRCSACPYMTKSRTEFLYHKQFHRPRGARFQCYLCSYNDPRRQFLQRHLRLHGISTTLPKVKNSGTFDPETPLNIKEIDTSSMTEIPLVWVSKLGSLTKMFKCRYCPHVNIRKTNIQVHEKMHGIRIKPNAEGSSPIPQQQHHCPECNYICNNAGALPSHVKVHQGLFGQVCGLVDLTRSDEEQIRDLNALLGREEEGPPEISPDEII